MGDVPGRAVKRRAPFGLNHGFAKALLSCVLFAACGGSRFAATSDTGGNGGAAQGGARAGSTGSGGKIMSAPPDASGSAGRTQGGGSGQAGRNSQGGASGEAAQGGDTTQGGDASEGGDSGQAGEGGGGHGGTAGALGVGGLGLGGLPIIAGSGGKTGIAGGAPTVTDGLALWLAADREVTEQSGGVARWADLSGNANDATQGVSAARPRRSTSSGSRAMIEFDGEDDYLSVADGFADFSRGLSFFALAEVTRDPHCSSLLQLSNGNEHDDIDVGIIGGNSLGFEVETEYFDSGEVFEPAERVLIGVIHRAGTDGLAELRVNGEYVGGKVIPAAPSKIRYDNFIGRSLYDGCEPLGARIGELLLYDRELSEAERVTVQNYLEKRWQ